MSSSHSFHLIDANKGHIPFTFGHTHPGILETKSPPLEIKSSGRNSPLYCVSLQSPIEETTGEYPGGGREVRRVRVPYTTLMNPRLHQDANTVKMQANA